MIRSSKHTLRFSNQGKQEILKNFIDEYRSLVKKYVNILWNNYQSKLPSMLESEVCNSIKSDQSSRLKQCAAKQACAMVKSSLAKHNKRMYVLQKLQREGKNPIYLQRKISLSEPKKPNCDRINVELDSRFVNFQEGNHFDQFVQIIWNGVKIRVPIKHTKVSKYWSGRGELKGSIRLSQGSITLYFDVQKAEKIKGIKVGAD